MMFTSFASDSSPALQYLFTVFFAITIYNAAEVIILAFATFKRYTGCYFTSLLVTSTGLTISTIGNVYYFYSNDTQKYAPVSLALIGWCAFVTGQALVLWSRLHIVTQNRTTQTAILILIITTAVLLYPPTIVLAYLGNGPNTTPSISLAYRIWEDIQLSLLTLQEGIISATYIWHVFRLSKLLADNYKQKIIYQLLAINAIILVMDGILLGVQFSGYRGVQIPLKGLIYSLKLKLEFAVLGRLVSFSRPGGSGTWDGNGGRLVASGSP